MKTVIVLDQYGYASIMTPEEFQETYGKLGPEYIPTNMHMSNEQIAAEFQQRQNEYTRNRITEGI